MRFEPDRKLDRQQAFGQTLKHPSPSTAAERSNPLLIVNDQGRVICKHRIGPRLNVINRRF